MILPRFFLPGLVLLALSMPSLSAAPANPPAGSSARKIKAVDADNKTIQINRLGYVTLVVITNEDSQKGARDAGKAMYPFQGRRDFELIVVVDLRGSMAAWVPSVVIDRMRASLDQEAVELKPYYEANGNHSNPRSYSHVVPDFKGTVMPQLGWPEGSENLRGVLFNAKGEEIKRWDNLHDMTQLQADVHAALEDLVASNTAKSDAANKARATKPIQLPSPTPLKPLPPARP